MKRIITGVFAILIILVCIIAAIPFLVSSETVRDGITFRIEKLTGRKVTFKGDPALSFSPFLGFEISDLELIDPSRDVENNILLKVEKVKAQLDLIPVLMGKIHITKYQFLRPRVLLKRSSDGFANWNFTNGGFQEAIQKATENRENQTDELVPVSSIGDLIIQDGIVLFEDDISGQTETITGMNGTLSWPDTDNELNITGNGIWRGEGITTNSIIENPVEIFSGGQSPVSVDLNSQPLTVNFDGQANMLANLFVKGKLSASTPSISRLTKVLDVSIGGFNSLEQWSATGELEATANGTNLIDATFTAGESTAMGVIRLSTNENAQSKLDGTLAFENINLTNSLLSAQTSGNELTPQLIEDLNVDLRISSQTMTLGSINLEKVASAIIIDKEGWTFDIGDAEAFNGKLVAKLGERINEDRKQAFLDISATDVDAEAITSIIGDSRISVNGKTSFVTNIRTNNLKSELLSSEFNGSFSGNFSTGIITGLKLSDAFDIEENDTKDEPKIFDENATQAFQEMNINLFFNNGNAVISKGQIKIAEDEEIQSIGSFNLNNGNLDIQLQERNKGILQEKRLFIKGTTSQPETAITNPSE